jgi:hypothetical protein
MPTPSRFGFHKLTRRSVEWGDDSVEGLAPREREAIATMWATRAEAELRVGIRLAFISTELLLLNADPQVLALATRAPSDEIRHAELCRRVASRYRGIDVPWPACSGSPMVERHGSSAEYRCAVELLGMCCISETLASAYLQACYSAARARLAREALSELLADEIEHARLGFAHLASSQVEASIRTQLSGPLVHLLEAALHVWTTQNPCPIAGGVPEHGLLPDEQVRSIVIGAVGDLVLPGLTELGIDTRPAKSWLARAAR